MSKPDTVLQLGEISFTGLEVPENIPWGGEQKLVVHELVGGSRTVQSLGRQDRPLDWSGIFHGEDASSRARQLDFLRLQGLPLELRWGEFHYFVVIRSFLPDYQRFYLVPYEISCVVVEDIVALTKLSAISDPDSVIRGQLGDAQSVISGAEEQGWFDQVVTGAFDGINVITGTVGDVVDTVMGPVESAIEVVSDFATATQETLNSVLTPLSNAQKTVLRLISSVNNTVNNVTTVGGLFPNNNVAQQTRAFGQQIQSYGNLSALPQLSSVFGGMQTNLGNLRGVGGVTTGLVQSTTSIGTSITTAGGNLYQIAQDAYGDALKWTGIAEANDLDDPELDGVNTLLIPPNPPDTGGVRGS